MVTRFIPQTLIGLLALVLLLGGCGDEIAQIGNGDEPPGFTLETLDGTTRSLDGTHQGKVIALRFWADWCPFCEGEMRALGPVYERLEHEGLEILAINVRQDRATAARFVEPLDIDYPVLLDSDGTVARAYGVIGLPTTFLIGRDGRVASRILGESTAEAFEAAVRELL